MTAATKFGCRIVDGKDDLKIHVKPADIKGAVCRDHEKCVVARAIKRQKSASVKWVDVGAHVVLIGTSQNVCKRYFMSAPAKEQIRFFDTNDGKFAPCAVLLKAPALASKSIGCRPIGTRTGQKDPPGRKRNKAKARRLPTR